MKPAIVVIITIGVGVLAFFGGMKYQENIATTTRSSSFANGARMGVGRMGVTGAGNRTGFRPVNGEVLNTDDASLTVKLTDGSSKIVLFTTKTIINKATTAQKVDIKAGEKVAVFGTENADGSVTAQTVQLNPLSIQNRPAN